MIYKEYNILEESPANAGTYMLTSNSDDYEFLGLVYFDGDNWRFDENHSCIEDSSIEDLISKAVINGKSKIYWLKVS